MNVKGIRAVMRRLKRICLCSVLVLPDNDSVHPSEHADKLPSLDRSLVRLPSPLAP